MRRIRLLGWAALLATVAACDRSRPGTARDDATGNLEGRWTLELRLEHPAQLRADTAEMKPVRGVVVLLRNRPPRRPDGEARSLPTLYGSHTLDVRPFGIALRRAGPVPTVSARPAGADSVVLTLDPDAPGGGLTLAGRLAGDSAAGRWWWHGPGRSAGASGRFTLRRK
jgi:hypothetical protein